MPENLPLSGICVPCLIACSVGEIKEASLIGHSDTDTFIVWCNTWGVQRVDEHAVALAL